MVNVAAHVDLSMLINTTNMTKSSHKIWHIGCGINKMEKKS